MALVRSFTGRKIPGRMAWRVMMPTKISAMLSHDHPVGVKCRVTRGDLLEEPPGTPGAGVGGSGRPG